MTQTEADIAVIKNEMKSMHEKLDEALDIMKGSDSKPGLILDVDRLKQNDARRTWLLRTLVAAMCALGLQAMATRLGWF
jgi:hypothetical protein